MRTLLWAEYKKLHRSSIVWITIFATVMIAVIVFAEGQAIHNGPDMQYGLKTVYEGSKYIENAGWYMDEAQPLATIFILPSVIALLGSYMICREEEDDTMKSLSLIPVSDAKLTVAKMVMTFIFSILIYLLLFVITFLTESVLHFSELSVELILSCMKEYLLDGIGVFLAISPVVAFVARKKKGYWIALVFTEFYSVAGLFAGMSSTLLVLYPINAVFNLSGYHITTVEKRAASIIVLLLCGGLSVFLLECLKHSRKSE
ncbi:MAG: ABC transporter permease [Eubacteriales bacterium]|nr:ABC transporter permease [Eubacteriales bacterium]